jgi:hypothetical protein
MKITDGFQLKIGSAGYIVDFDLTDYDINNMIGVQVQKTSLQWSGAVTAMTEYDQLSNYVDNPLCPDVAFCWMRNNLFVFVKSTYTYVDTTILDFWYYRNAQNVTTVNDKVDIPGEFEQLALLLILRSVYLDQNISLPQNIGQQIRTQCTNLNINYPI